jgi:hypothetical protein
MFVCCECCVLSGRGLCEGLIIRPEKSYRLWRVVVCDQESSNTRRLKPATGLWKIQPQWVVTPGKQTNNIFGAIALYSQKSTIACCTDSFIYLSVSFPTSFGIWIHRAYNTHRISDFVTCNISRKTESVIWTQHIHTYIYIHIYIHIYIIIIISQFYNFILCGVQYLLYITVNNTTSILIISKVSNS